MTGTVHIKINSYKLVNVGKKLVLSSGPEQKLMDSVSYKKYYTKVKL